MKWEIGRLKGLPRWVVMTLLILLGVPALMGLLLAVFLWFNPIVF
jgi:hypothetical protein